MRYPPAVVSIADEPTARRRRTTDPCTTLPQVFGGASPHNASASTSAGTA